VPEAEKTGQVLVRTLPTPRPAGTPMISGEEVGYVRRSELRRKRLPQFKLSACGAGLLENGGFDITKLIFSKEHFVTDEKRR
jgi:hypothetical protein